MITRRLAERLRHAGLRWEPTSGDRFLVPDRDLDTEVFVVSDMMIEAAQLPTGVEMRFNGNVEWALDSIAQREVIWLPREDQLRDRLGDRFLALEAVPGPRPAYAVAVTAPAGPQRHLDEDAECAYARALAAVLEESGAG